jgi:hypothetical protein
MKAENEKVAVYLMPPGAIASPRDHPESSWSFQQQGTCVILGDRSAAFTESRVNRGQVVGCSSMTNPRSK